MGAGDVNAFRRELINVCPPLRMMYDLSDASHHRFLTRRSDPPRIVDSSTGAYSLSDKLLVNGYARPFLEEAALAVKFWHEWKD